MQADYSTKLTPPLEAKHWYGKMNNFAFDNNNNNNNKRHESAGGESFVAMTATMTDSTHVSESRQQVEGEEGFRVRRGLGPAQRGTSQRRQSAVAHIT